MRCYKYVYGASAFFFQDIALRSNDEQKQKFLQRVYHDWLPADELAVFRDQLLSPAMIYGASDSKVATSQP